MIHVGSQVRLRCEVRDYDGLSADPTGVDFEIVSPDGVVANYTHSSGIVRIGKGVYTLQLQCTQVGRYRWSVICSGAIMAYESSSFLVGAQRT